MPIFAANFPDAMVFILIMIARFLINIKRFDILRRYGNKANTLPTVNKIL